MSALRDMIAANGPIWLAVGGFAIGTAFGAIVFATNFCTMGAVSDMVTLDDRRRFRAWLLAAATALAGAQLLYWAGVVDLAASMYLSPTLNWAGHIAGGLIFGFGMVFGGGCPSRNLARVGSGDLRALIVLLVLGIFAYMAMGGILGPLRAGIERMTSIPLASPTQGTGDLVAALGILPPDISTLVVSAAIVGAVMTYCFGSAEFRASPIHVWSGIGVGLCAVAGWALTGLAFDEMSVRPTQPISLTYVRPTADAVEWLERYTAARMPGFGVATVFGAIIGAFGAAVAKRRFRVTGFSDTGDTLRSLAGASLMGIGGVMALGCTIGQGITGVSTLALGSFLSFAAIVAGGVMGVRTLEWWLMRE